MIKSSALIVATAAILGGCGQTQEQIDKDNLWTVTFRCKEAIKAQLRDPDSVAWESDSAKAVSGGWVVKVDYRAKNGFGGYTAGGHTCVVDSKGKVQAVLKQ